MDAFLCDSRIHRKTKLNYKSQVKYIVICPGSALAGSCPIREWNITSIQINPPKAGYYPHSHNFQLVHNTGRGYSVPLPKDTAHSRSHSFLYTGHEYWKKSQKTINLFFLYQMLHLKMYVQKMCYSSAMPSRKQSHYRYQNENLHLLSHLGHVFFIPNLQSKPGTHNKALYTFFFFFSVRAGLFHCSWIRAGTSTGNKVLGLEYPYQLDPFNIFYIIFYSLWKKLCYKHGFALALFKHRTCSVPSWKLLLETGQCSLCQVTLSVEKPCRLGGFNLKADLCVFYIYLILIWRYKDSYCILSNL